ncbi:helix-turn-helix domain-containing protein [Streptomyces pini]|uniref:DNA-binding transcriptional regulator, XRE-family HTH domain n=1 Tax=Streptomyces pini TaxID=1520580 RepID=A0A1I4B603_9ACTN|nr:helix-turn-helix transcriptional regulator [Streptomyces pini]SFK63339.1 DNA-binding transcriptional regulator, XRE-family HTH domain [Streptomyces pini]
MGSTAVDTGTGTSRPANGVGPLLRHWRERAGLSQLELALRADSSARHISFVETGRTRPSPRMVLRLAEHLDVPVRERNALLMAAGHAPHYPETPVDDPSLAALREGLERMLTAYEPFPALVVDGRYEVVAANRGIAALLEGVAEHLLRPPLNAMRLTLHPDGLAPRIRNLPQWREHLLEQMRRQLALLRSAPLRELYEEVAAHPVPGGDTERRGTASPFALPLVIEHQGHVLSFFSTITAFNTPMDVTVSELAMETFVPADPETAALLPRLLG